MTAASIYVLPLHYNALAVTCHRVPNSRTTTFPPDMTWTSMTTSQRGSDPMRSRSTCCGVTPAPVFFAAVSTGPRLTLPPPPAPNHPRVCVRGWMSCFGVVLVFVVLCGEINDEFRPGKRLARCWRALRTGPTACRTRCTSCRRRLRGTRIR